MVGVMAGNDVIRFKLDSGIVVTDYVALFGWIIDQVNKRRGEYEHVWDWVNPELGGESEDVVIPIGSDAVFHLNDEVSVLQLVATLLIGSIPGLEEVDSFWNVDWDEPPTG